MTPTLARQAEEALSTLISAIPDDKRDGKIEAAVRTVSLGLFELHQMTNAVEQIGWTLYHRNNEANRTLASLEASKKEIPA
jgi:methylphosphotriester-DNA--protein-cysteine methyltransferase